MSRKSKMLLLAVGATALFTGSVAKSAVRTWDGSNTSNSQADGGTGTWDSNTTANWWNGSTNVVWPNSGTDNDALFANTAGTVTLSSLTANDLTFGTTGYVLSGASTLTLNGTTPTIDTGANSATIGNNTALVLDGSSGLTKSGSGTLTLNGSAVNTLSGGVNVKGGTLSLNLGNLATPTNQISNTNALNLSNGSTLLVTGKTGAVASQTFGGININGGANVVAINNAGTSTTVALGAVTQNEPGAVVSFEKADFAGLNTTTHIVTVSGYTTGSYMGSWAFVGDSKTINLRWANVNASGQVVAITGTTATASTMANATSATTVYTATGTFNLTASQTAFGLQSNNTGSASTYNLNGNTLTTNGILTIQPNSFATTVQGTGSLQVGAGNELVMAGAAAINIASPIINKAASNSHVTYAGGSTLTLTAANTFSGQLSVDSGTVIIGAGGSVNNANGVKLFGGKLLLTNTTTAVSPTVTMAQGSAGATLDGTGTYNNIVVSSSSTNKITNGNGATSALTIGNLTFNGAGAIDVRTAGSAGLTVTNTLTTTPANGSLTINVTQAPTWVTGNTYNLIGFGSWSGAVTDLTQGTITGLGARQTATLGKSASTSGFITLAIGGDSVVWTGAAGNSWTTNAVGTPFNWKTQTGLADTEFLTGDDVVFPNVAGNYSVEISTANVSPNTMTFSNNSPNNYTISSSGGFGIATGSLTKSGTGTVSLTTTNTYTGLTTINAGTLKVSNGNAIANTGLVTLGNVAGATFHVVGSESIGALSGGGATGGAVSIDAGQTLTLTGGTQTYAGTVSGSGALTNSGAVQTLNGALSHSGGVNVPSGVLTLGNSANTYTGQTSVSAGAGIVVSANNALGATGTGNEVILAGTGNAVSGVIGLSGGVNYTSAKKIIGSGLGNTSANGVFAVAQRGIVQSVSGNNTFAGNIEINSASVTRIGVQDNAQLTLTGSITMSTGVTGVQVLFRGGGTAGDYITLASTGNVWDLDTVVFSNNTTTGAGLRLGANNALPTNVSAVGSSSAGSGATLDLNGFNQTLNGLNDNTGPSGSGPLKISNSNSLTPSTLTLNNLISTKTVSQTSIVDGAGIVNLVKQGANTFQTINSTNNYSGTTTVQSGILIFGKPASLYNAVNTNWTASKITVESGAVFSTTVGGAAEFLATDVATLLSGLTTVSNNGLKAGSVFGFNTSAAFTYSNIITDSTGPGGGAVGIIKYGSGGTLTLDQPNTFSGGFRLNNNIAIVAHNNALGTGTVTFGAGASILKINNGINLPNAIDISTVATGASFNGLIQNSNAAAGETITLSGPINITVSPTNGGHFASQGTGSILNITGSITSSVKWSQRAGTIVYSGGGSYTDAGIGGTAVLGATNGLATNATIDLGLSAAGTLDLAGYNQSLAGITKNSNAGTIGNSSTTTDSTLTLTGTSSFGGVIQNAVGAGTRKVNLAVNGSSQTFTLAGINTYSGDTTIKAGTLALAATGSIDNSPIITVGDTGSSGTVLDVSAKTAFAVGATQTLKGIGTVNVGTGKILTVNGTIAPGNSVGTLTVNSALTLAGTSDFEISKAGSTLAGDQIIGLTSLTYGGTLKITPASGSDAASTYVAGNSWDLFGGSGAVENPITTYSGTFANDSAFGTQGGGATNLPALSAGLKWTFDYSSGILSVTNSSTPATISLSGTAGNSIVSDDSNASDNVGSPTVGVGKVDITQNGLGAYVSEIDGLTTNTAVGTVELSQSVDTPVYAMFWLIDGDNDKYAALASTLDAIGGVEAWSSDPGSGNEWSNLASAYSGFNMLVRFSSATTETYLNWNFGSGNSYDGVLVDRIAIVPEPTSAVAGLVLGATSILARRRRRAV